MSYRAIEPERCVYLTDYIGRESYNRLFVHITDLKAESDAPIYLVIDSLGGSTLYAERIFNLITSPRCDGTVCPFVAVAPQLAASAAADLLILSDHAVVGQDSKILCHGTRTGRDDITEESLADLDLVLKSSNRIHTTRLSTRVTSRLSSVLLYFNSGRDLISYPSTVKVPEPDEKGLRFLNAKDYLNWIKVELSDKGRDVVNKAMISLDEWMQPHLDGYADSKEGLVRRIFDDSMAEYDFADGNSNISDFAWGFYQKISKHSGYDLYLGLIADDEHREKLLLNHLSDSEFEELEKEFGDDSKGFFEKVVAIAGDRAVTTRCLAMTLCDALHKDENDLTGIDAYYLGLVDEIQGISDFPSKLRPRMKMPTPDEDTPDEDTPDSAKHPI